MNAILILGIFQGVFLSILLLAKKYRNLSDYLLSLVFLVFALTTFFSFMELYNRQNDYPFPIFLNSSPPMIMLHGPIIWFYVKSLTTQNFRFKIKYLLHFVPFAIVFMLLFSGHFFLQLEDRIEIDKNQDFKNKLIYPIVIACIAISSHSYIIASLMSVRKYQNRIKIYFSEISQINLSWLKILLYSVLVLYAINSSTYIIDYFWPLMPYSNMQVLAHSIASIFIFAMAFFGLKQENIFTGSSLKMNNVNSEQTYASGKLDSKDEEFIKQLVHFMHQFKPYLDQNITVTGLSNQLKISQEYLSGILNSQLNKNFYDFINHYRIKEFKIRSKDPKNKDYTLMSIALDCGFNSKATFNRVFKKSTGITPSQFVRQVSKN